MTGRRTACVRKYDFISALEKETAAEVVKNREEWMKYLITAVSFLITDFSRSKSLYQMIGFVRTVLPAMVKGVLKVNRCCFRYCLPALQSDSDLSWFVQALYYNFADNCNRHHTHIHIKPVCVRKLNAFHAGCFELGIENVLLIITEIKLHQIGAVSVCHWVKSFLKMGTKKLL